MENISAKEYHKKASDIISPMSNDFAVAYLLYTIIFIVASSLGFGIISFVLSGPFNFGLINMSINAKKGQKPLVKDLFWGFDRFTQAFLVTLLNSVFLLLWTLLFIIPGIIKSYSYAMSSYIAIENPNMSAQECITESRKIMNGNKWKLFCLQISYIGWFLLVILTLGILSFWVTPKYYQAHYEFYLHVTKRN